MKRGSSNLHQLHVVDEEAKAKVKHQNLLNEYLELLKESVSRKRKLKNRNKKRDALLAEVIFLRRRRRYLLKHQSSNSEVDKDLHLRNSDVDRPIIEGKRNDTPYEAAEGKNLPLRHEEGVGGGGEEEEIVQEVLRVEKVPRNYFINDKRRIGKKKILWQDQVTLKV